MFCGIQQNECHSLDGFKSKAFSCLLPFNKIASLREDVASILANRMEFCKSRFVFVTACTWNKASLIITVSRYLVWLVGNFFTFKSTISRNASESWKS